MPLPPFVQLRIAPAVEALAQQIRCFGEDNPPGVGPGLIVLEDEVAVPPGAFCAPVSELFENQQLSGRVGPVEKRAPVEDREIGDRGPGDDVLAQRLEVGAGIHRWWDDVGKPAARGQQVRARP